MQELQDGVGGGRLRGRQAGGLGDLRGHRRLLDGPRCRGGYGDRDLELDRRGLKSASCGCYKADCESYARVLG